MTYRHVFEVDDACGHCRALGEHLCATPTPDPASPCGYVYLDGGQVCGRDADHEIHQPPCWPPYIATRCLTCSHPIEPVPA